MRKCKSIGLTALILGVSLAASSVSFAQVSGGGAGGSGGPGSGSTAGSAAPSGSYMNKSNMDSTNGNTDLSSGANMSAPASGNTGSPASKYPAPDGGTGR